MVAPGCRFSAAGWRATPSAYGARMRHAIYLPPFATFGDVDIVLEVAADAEAAGWDGLFMWDHLLFSEDVPFVDPWIALAAVAARTQRLTIGPLVTPLARRRVHKVARESVTLDHLSKGRLVLGVGLGIDFWREYSAFAEAATTDRVRSEMLNEGVEALRALWTGEPVSYAGHHVTIDGARFLPRPHQPTIPIWAAAFWPLRSDRPIRRAAGCDGVIPFDERGPLRPDDVVELRRRLGKEGDLSYDVCLHGPQDWATDYEAAGVTWLMLSFGPDQPLDEVRSLTGAGPPRT